MEKLTEETELYCERYKIREERRRREAYPTTSIFFSSTEGVDMILEMIPSLGWLNKMGMIGINVSDQSVLDYLTAKLAS